LIHMMELLTIDEAARYLQLSERKLYELVSHGAVPSTKVTGRWLYPRAALDRWVLSGLQGSTGTTTAPPIVGGSQDPLLEWALRESRCGLASLPEGSENGIGRLARGEVVAAGCHFHCLEGNDEEANQEIVKQTPGLHDAVVISFARREQGLLVAGGNTLGLTDLSDVVGKHARMAQRQPGAGAQLLLLTRLARAGVEPGALNLIKSRYATGSDLAQAIRAGHADCGIATRAVARAVGLDFVALRWERFDLVLRQRDYFQPPMQALLKFMRSTSFRDQSAELGGFDVTETGSVRLAT
jgi:excisionase family DNA binding protein